MLLSLWETKVAITPFAVHRIDSLAKIICFPPYHFYASPFLPLVRLLLKKTSNTILNKNGDKGYFCFVLNLRLVD